MGCPRGENRIRGLSSAATSRAGLGWDMRLRGVLGRVSASMARLGHPRILTETGRARPVSRTSTLVHSDGEQKGMKS